MKLSAPKGITFIISVILVVLGVLASQGTLPSLSVYSFGLVVIGFILLALANLMKGL